MHNQEDLIAEIESQKQTIKMLEIQIDALRRDGKQVSIEIAHNPKRQNPFNFLINLIAVASYPIIGGLFRAIYKRIYREKK